MYSLVSLSCIALLCCSVSAAKVQDSHSAHKAFFDEPTDNATTKWSVLPETTTQLPQTNSSFNSSSECRKVCTPDACSNATCSKFQNATCISDLCGCSARFITLNLNRTSILDVTEFCAGNDSAVNWTIPKAVDKQGGSSELPVLPGGSPATSSNSTTAPEITSNPTVIAQVPQTIVQPLAQPVQMYTIGRQPEQAFQYSNPMAAVGNGLGMGVFSGLTYGQNGLWNIAPNVIRQFPFGELVVPGYSSRSLAIPGAQVDDETKNDEGGEYNDDDEENDESKNEEDVMTFDLDMNDELMERKGGKNHHKGGIKQGNQKGGKKHGNQNKVGKKQRGQGAAVEGAEPVDPAVPVEGAEPVETKPDAETTESAGNVEEAVGEVEPVGEEEEVENVCRQVCHHRRNCFRARRGRQVCRRRRVCRRVC